MQRATNKDLLYKGSFQEAIGSVLIMAQCFAIMPVVGVKCDTAAEIYFSWKSYRTIYTLITFVLTTIYAALTIYTTFSVKVEFDLIGLFRIFNF